MYRKTANQRVGPDPLDTNRGTWMTPTKARRAALLTVLTALTALLAAVPAQAVSKKKSIWGPVTLPGGESAFPTY